MARVHASVCSGGRCAPTGIVVCNGLSLGFERRQFRNELLLGLLEDLLRVKVIDLARLEPFVAPGAVVHDVGHEIADDGRGPVIDVRIGFILLIASSRISARPNGSSIFLGRDPLCRRRAGFYFGGSRPRPRSPRSGGTWCLGAAYGGVERPPMPCVSSARGL